VSIVQKKLESYISPMNFMVAPCINNTTHFIVHMA